MVQLACHRRFDPPAVLHLMVNAATLQMSVDVPQPPPDVVPLPPSPHPVPPTQPTPPEVQEPPMPGHEPVIDPLTPSSENDLPTLQ